MELKLKERIGETGLYGRAVGHVDNIWEMIDEGTGESIRGVKLEFYGGSQSVQFQNPEEIDSLLQGDFIIWEGQMKISKKGIKLAKGRLVEVNGKAFGRKN